jgi:hypothetical protein
VVKVSGVFTEFRRLEEISVAKGGSVTILGTAPLPTPITVRPSEINESGSRARELQSMLLQVKNVQATSATRGTDFLVASFEAPETALVVSSFVAHDVGPSPFPADFVEVWTS